MSDHNMKSLVEAVLGFLFPRRAVCLGCGSMAGFPQDWLCQDCRQALAMSWAGADLPPRGLDGAAYAYIYRGPAAKLVRALKYGGVSRLAPFMAGDMAKAYHAIEPTGADCVAWVPMHPKRRRTRGYNHAELLAREVAARLKLEPVDALRAVRAVRQQARLDSAQRMENLRGVIEAHADLTGRRVLLIDDVRTTGATAHACADALRRAGAERVYLLCYCVAKGEK